MDGCSVYFTRQFFFDFQKAGFDTDTVIDRCAMLLGFFLVAACFVDFLFDSILMFLWIVHFLCLERLTVGLLSEICIL